MNYFIELDKLEANEALKGALLGTLQTENLTLAFTKMKAGTKIPLHHHVAEAVDIVLEGEMEMEIGGLVSRVKHGMLSIVPSDVPHKAKAVTDCKVVTILYPRREM